MKDTGMALEFVVKPFKPPQLSASTNYNPASFIPSLPAMRPFMCEAWRNFKEVVSQASIHMI
jgi:hypothetical protein